MNTIQIKARFFIHFFILVLCICGCSSERKFSFIKNDRSGHKTENDFSRIDIGTKEEFYASLAKIVFDGKYDEAIQFIEERGNNLLTLADRTEDKAFCLSLKGDYHRAIQEIEKFANSSKDDNSRLDSILSVLYSINHDYSKAEQFITKIINNTFSIRAGHASDSDTDTLITLYGNRAILRLVQAKWGEAKHDIDILKTMLPGGFSVYENGEGRSIHDFSVLRKELEEKRILLKPVSLIEAKKPANKDSNIIYRWTMEWKVVDCVTEKEVTE